jgi:hypothetical protein
MFIDAKQYWAKEIQVNLQEQMKRIRNDKYEVNMTKGVFIFLAAHLSHESM